MNNNKLLIICYSFPPTPGIGGRRWAKFAKYMLRSGMDVQILKASDERREISDWYKDTFVLEEENRVHTFGTGYPGIILGIPENIFRKIRYHLTLLWLKLKNKREFL